MAKSPDKMHLSVVSELIEQKYLA